jgi:hypothetical protein
LKDLENILKPLTNEKDQRVLTRMERFRADLEGRIQEQGPMRLQADDIYNNAQNYVNELLNKQAPKNTGKDEINKGSRAKEQAPKNTGKAEVQQGSRANEQAPKNKKKMSVEEIKKKLEAQSDELREQFTEIFKDLHKSYKDRSATPAKIVLAKHYKWARYGPEHGVFRTKDEIAARIEKAQQEVDSLKITHPWVVQDSKEWTGFPPASVEPVTKKMFKASNESPKGIKMPDSYEELQRIGKDIWDAVRFNTNDRAIKKAAKTAGEAFYLWAWHNQKDNKAWTQRIQYELAERDEMLKSIDSNVSEKIANSSPDAQGSSSKGTKKTGA